MFHPTTPLKPATSCDIAALLERLAQVSSRPRYAFMLLNLIAQVAGPDGSAGPWIKRDNELVSLRDWLCDALTPMASAAYVTQRWPNECTETSSEVDRSRAMQRMHSGRSLRKCACAFEPPAKAISAVWFPSS